MRSGMSGVFGTVILALVVLFVVRAVAQNFEVEGSSMAPTLRTGQRLIVNKVAYASLNVSAVLSRLPWGADEANEGARLALGTPSRGDVVVFHYPLDPTRDFVKRVIGTPGDRVEIADGQVYVNGWPLVEPYLGSAPDYRTNAVDVPAGHLFVLGDNRTHSSDSHVWGLVPEENVIGKVVMCYWPLDHLGVVASPSPLPAQATRSDRSVPEPRN